MITIDHRTEAWRVTGEVRALGKSAVTLRAGGARGGDWVALALQAKLAGLSSGWLLGIEESAPCVGSLDAGKLDEKWLDVAVAHYLRSREGHVPLLRQSSWAYAKHGSADAVKGINAARQVLGVANRGQPDARPESAEPAVALLLRGRRDPLDAAFAAAADAVLVPLRAAIKEDAT